MSKRVVIAMSGGVDSSVAAALLVEQGYDVIGVSMRLHDTPPVTPDGHAAGCCSLDDFLDARAVASKLGIPHYVINFAEEFEATVIQTFLAEYRSGRTPLPCAVCNERVKFDALLRRALGLGAEWVATGHYARITHTPEGPELRAGLDPVKDQSYFLFGTPTSLLERVLFPVGELTKAQVRERATALGLVTAAKPESQELCFVPDGNVAAAVERLGGVEGEPGPIVDTDGHVLGTHDGVHHFTVGQRRGLGLSSHNKLYVLGLDAGARTVTVGREEDLDQSELIAADVNWLASVADGTRAGVRIRHRNQPTAATLYHLDDRRVRVVFDEPKKAVAPGQAAVFYDDDRVLGGGWIQ